MTGMDAPACPAELVAFAHRLADDAAAVHRRYFRRPVPVEVKPDGSPVTAADREAEQAVHELVARHHPDHGVVGEELEPRNPDAEHVWIVDPLDGTKLFLMGRPLFGVLLALAHRGRFVLGLLDQPVLGERWLGADGHGSTFNGRAVRTRACASLADATMCRQGVGDNSLGRDAALDRVAERVRWVQWGVTPYDYGQIALGFVDLIVAAGPQLHDLAPIDPVIRNAGGAASDWSGASLTPASGPFVIAAGDPRLIDQVLPLLEA